MDNEFFPIAFWKHDPENIITVVLSIKSLAFRKRVKRVKPHRIPRNRKYLFWVLNRMSWSFRRLFFRAEPDMLMVCRKTDHDS
jgi:hypothetical protein